MVAIEKSNGRLIKPHRKSRAGCRPCKLRKVKCDEGKPDCQRCLVSGDRCSYNNTDSALQFLVNGVAKATAIDVVAFTLKPSKSLGVSQYVFEENDVRLLSRFRSRTSLTITMDRNRSVYQNDIIEIARVVSGCDAFLANALTETPTLVPISDAHFTSTDKHARTLYQGTVKQLSILR